METIAVIETGGKQYRVAKDEVISIELIPGKKEGDTVTFDKVLLYDDGKSTQIGTPYIDKLTVQGTIESIERKKKISVIKFKSKSNYKRKYGHRQPFVKVRIGAIA